MFLRLSLSSAMRSVSEKKNSTNSSLQRTYKTSLSCTQRHRKHLCSCTLCPPPKRGSVFTLQAFVLNQQHMYVRTCMLSFLLKTQHGVRDQKARAPLNFARPKNIIFFITEQEYLAVKTHAESAPTFSFPFSV